MTKVVKKSKAVDLIFAYTLFVLVFVISKGLSNKVTNEFPALSVFLGASILTLLCILVVHGFSRLKLHRSKYLLLGALGLVGVYYFATPMVNKAKFTNQVKAYTVAVYEQVAVLHLDYSLGHKFIEAHKGCFDDMLGYLSGALKEPLGFILLLALAQILLASGLGLWIGEGIDKISHLLPVALVAGVADIWSVFAGATAEIILSPSMNYFFLRFPVLGMEKLPYLIGLTDYLFYGIFFQAAVRFKLGTFKNSLLLVSSFLLTVGFALYFEAGLPVLPFMGLLFVAGNFKSLKIDKKELKEMLVFLIGIGVVFFLITYFMNK